MPVLALPAAAWSTRMMRASVLDAYRLPHVEAARLSGMPESRVSCATCCPTP
jgi:ABC-type dipeptide/oligopeptide/nickel transport system permease component